MAPHEGKDPHEGGIFFDFFVFTVKQLFFLISFLQIPLYPPFIKRGI